MQMERERELHQSIEDAEERLYQCNKTKQQMEQMEEESARKILLSKEINDDLFAFCTQDARLQNILFERDELIQRRAVLQKNMLQECGEQIEERKKRAMKELEEYREELKEWSK